MQNKSVNLRAIPLPRQLQISPKRSERSERRYDFPLPVIVLGFTACSVLFHEATVARNVSPHGFGLHLRNLPQTCETLAVSFVAWEKAVTPPQHALCEIVWIEQQDFGWDLGARALFNVDVLALAFHDSAGKIPATLRLP